MEGHNKEIKVSVMCLTYNHVNTIRDALEGFLMQKTDFMYDVLIYDDASTDGTSDIVREYVLKYPDLFHAVIAEENIWKNPQRSVIFKELFKEHIAGKYMALCEGDDFWIDCNKLQIQVDYMERHPECMMYMHNALWLNCKDGTMKAGNSFGGVDERDLSAEEVIMMYKGHPPTASFFYRKEVEEGPDFFYNAAVGDYTRTLYALTCGSIHYSNRIMSVYRYLGHGSYSESVGKDLDLNIHFKLGLINFLYEYDSYTRNQYHQWCASKIHAYAVSLVHEAKRNISMLDNIRHSMLRGYYFSKKTLAFAEKLEVFRCQWSDKNYVSDRVIKFIENYEHIFIMGAGKCATMLAIQFVNHQMHFDGFVVTSRDRDIYMNMPVYSLKEIPRYDSVGVLIGINPTSPIMKDGLSDSLKEAGINNYIFPFFFDDVEAE